MIALSKMKQRLKKIDNFAAKLKAKHKSKLYSKIVDEVVKEYKQQIIIRQN